eukprot:6182510-Pleurochrysis_carterae.AAC.2
MKATRPAAELRDCLSWSRDFAISRHWRTITMRTLLRISPSIERRRASCSDRNAAITPPASERLQARTPAWAGDADGANGFSAGPEAMAFKASDTSFFETCVHAASLQSSLQMKATSLRMLLLLISRNGGFSRRHRTAHSTARLRSPVVCALQYAAESGESNRKRACASALAPAPTSAARASTTVPAPAPAPAPASVTAVASAPLGTAPACGCGSFTACRVHSAGQLAATRKSSRGASTSELKRSAKSISRESERSESASAPQSKAERQEWTRCAKPTRRALA